MWFKISKATRWKITFVVIILLMPCAIARSQSVSYGLRVGMPLNNLATADANRIAATGRYTVGPSMCIAMPRGFGLDVDLLYKRLDLGVASNAARITSHRLELVPLLRYVLTTAPIHPFVHAGISFNWILGRGGGSNACTDNVAEDKGYYCMEGNMVAQLRHSHTHGFVLGTGLDFQLRALRLTPELRFTRWVDRNFGTQDSSLRSNLTQIELLLGFAF
jgi:hypothetical protein